MMKNIFLIFCLLFSINSCFTQKKLIDKSDSIQIDYVDLYVMTPVNVTLENFYSYFGKSVQTITIKDKVIVAEIGDEMNKFLNTSKKAKILPDTRLIITFYQGDKKQVVTMGTTLLNINDESHILNDNIREYYGKLTNNEW